MWQPEERRFFSDVVRPLLGPDVEYVGEVDAAEEVRPTGRRRGADQSHRLAGTVRARMIEALATGTPVLAFAQGAAPETRR